ncbi:MAG: hypothetical protein WBG41_05270 [Acidimicrobiales bacterium]
MIAAQALAALFGVALTAAVLASALETVVLPLKGFTRIARAVFALTDRLLVHRWRNPRRTAHMRAIYAPVALVSLPLVWMLSVTVAFTFIFWGIGSGTVAHSFELSGSSLTTLGFSKPDGSARVWLSFVEAIIGLGLVALLIGYLPTIYTAYAAREKGMNALRPFAGTPPSPVTLVDNLHRSGALDNVGVWRQAADWLLTLDQTHTAFPALCYFPDAPDQSWVASLGSLLDGAALLLSGADYLVDQDPPPEIKGPRLVIAYGIPAIGRIAVAIGLPVEPMMTPSELSARDGLPPDVAVSRAEYEAALGDLDAVMAVPAGELDACWSRFAWLRSGYDQALRGLAGLNLAPPARWTTDRSVAVGRPRILSGRTLTVDWGTMPDVDAGIGP